MAIRCPHCEHQIWQLRRRTDIVQQEYIDVEVDHEGRLRFSDARPLSRSRGVAEPPTRYYCPMCRRRLEPSELVLELPPEPELPSPFDDYVDDYDDGFLDEDGSDAVGTRESAVWEVQ